MKLLIATIIMIFSQWSYSQIHRGLFSLSNDEHVYASYYIKITGKPALNIYENLNIVAESFSKNRIKSSEHIICQQSLVEVTCLLKVNIYGEILVVRPYDLALAKSSHLNKKGYLSVAYHDSQEVRTNRHSESFYITLTSPVNEFYSAASDLYEKLVLEPTYYIGQDDSLISSKYGVHLTAYKVEEGRNKTYSIELILNTNGEFLSRYKH